MFSSQLKTLREGLGFQSQQAFAAFFNLSPAAVADWEAGRQEPDIKTLVRLADCFNAPVDVLLGRMDVDTFTDTYDEWEGTQLALCRRNCGLSAEAVAAAVGVPTSLYLSYEAGNTCPSVTILCRLANRLNTTTDVLLGRLFSPSTAP